VNPDAFAAGAVAPNTAFSALSDYVEGTLETLKPCSAAILVSSHGQLLGERYLPGPEPQDPRIPVNQDSLWPWWSVTKSLTAALVARLAFTGLLSLDQNLSSALPEFREHGPGQFDRRTVTLRHLLSHASGCALPGRIEDGIHPGGIACDHVHRDLDLDLSEVAVMTRPGSVFVYSALGMHILERFIETLADCDYEEILRREILEPFGIGGLRYVYDERDTAWPRLLPCHKGLVVPSQSRQRCGLGVYGTARDLLKFGQGWLSLDGAGGLPWCSPELRSEFWTPHSVRPSDACEYGLLWWIFRKQGGFVASGASFSVCGILPRHDIVVAVARNHFGAPDRPFDYREDKIRILELAAACS
jgi:CubicO group peptidase (beta-lactamase class C family)